MLEPRTSPNGRKPASRTSRNSLTLRSEVNSVVLCPGFISASRRIASSGMLWPSTSALLIENSPSDCSSGLLAWAKGLLSGLAKGHDRERLGRRPPTGVEAGDGRAEHRRLRAEQRRVAGFLMPRPQAHAGHDRAVRAGAAGVRRERLP